MNDATIDKAVLLYVVLHNLVVTMGVYADIRIMHETEVHNTTEHSMNIRITGYTMNNMIWQ
jgi:hypothetical protein